MNQECWCVHMAVAVYWCKDYSLKLSPVFPAGNDVKDLFADAKSGDQYRVLKIILQDGKWCPVSSPEADDDLLAWLHGWNLCHSYCRAAECGLLQEILTNVGPRVWLLCTAPPWGWRALLHTVPAGFHQRPGLWVDLYGLVAGLCYCKNTELWADFNE